MDTQICWKLLSITNDQEMQIKMGYQSSRLVYNFTKKTDKDEKEKKPTHYW